MTSCFANLPVRVFKQWMQLKQYANSRGVQIIGDMPLYVASDSVDVWAHREMFLLGPDGRPNVVAGAAPDAFSESGQVWGSPVYDWNVMEEDGFAWWKARMLENMELFDVIRLDHFSGSGPLLHRFCRCRRRKKWQVEQRTWQETDRCHDRGSG